MAKDANAAAAAPETTPETTATPEAPTPDAGGGTQEEPATTEEPALTALTRVFSPERERVMNKLIGATKWATEMRPAVFNLLAREGTKGMSVAQRDHLMMLIGACDEIEDIGMKGVAILAEAN